MIGYKIAQVHKRSDKSDLNDQDIRRVLVTLQITDDAKTNLHRKDIVDSTKAKYRCNKATVLKITDNEGNEYPNATTHCYQDKKLKYIVGEEVEEKNYDLDNEVVCGEGIHFFLDKEVALFYSLYGEKEGLNRVWHDNGQLYIENTYRDGKEEGMFEGWHENGQKWKECHYQNGKFEGRYQEWNDNGQKLIDCQYLDGKKEGLYQEWWNNGQKLIESYYLDGKLEGLYQKWCDNGQKWIECIYRAGEAVEEVKN